MLRTDPAAGPRLVGADLRVRPLRSITGIVLITAETSTSRPAARNCYFPDARVRCARFVSTTKAEFLDRLDVEGTILEALQEVPRFIRRNTRMAARIESMRRQDIPEYPTVALREALTNAVAHADYSQPGMHIQVAITPTGSRFRVREPGLSP